VKQEAISTTFGLCLVSFLAPFQPEVWKLMRGNLEEKQDEEGFENGLTVDNKMLVGVACYGREFAS